MSSGLFKIPPAVNEPIKDYAPGSPERAALKKELERQSSIKVEIPAYIDGKPYFTANKEYVVMPHDHNHVLAEVSMADDEGIELAIRSSLAAKEKWADMPWQHRASIFIKALNLVRGPWRDRLNASTMLGQSKACFQAEIDAICEVCDFFSYNLSVMQEIYEFQPKQIPGAWNRMEYRGLDGFVLAISPFNFTALGANLSCAPAIMGNTVIWKPARTAMLSNYYFYLMLLEAGLPPGVINFLPASGSAVSRLIVPHPDLGGLNFIGSDTTFSTLWNNIGNNISTYNQYPRMVGETGGKDFIFVHPSADIPTLISAMVRGAFEYQGQKCAAASRAYVPRSLWPQVKEMLLEKTAEIKVGDPCDFTNLMGAVIDRSAFNSIKSYIDYANESEEAEVLTGHYDDSKGYFIYPTIIETTNPRFKTMREEIFGPVLTIYVYEDSEIDSAVKHCKEDTVYALTGSIFAQSREAIISLEKEFSYTAGNFYINDKPTGSAVGLQPFGGSKLSGTNDKTGTVMNLYRWTSARTIKENFVPTDDVNYISMQER
ncbi:MAG: L-glutamate gamma-semialdehyde dehydrogenase [Clostridiaceae bacterium]|nr:L-glutamate gamma-semialdehyde dehydrogenase [Clostridiaceae bacterium]HZW98377.1 L-glutamate gamma-semialdehyde dehydrogenase [Bacillota bacterium]